MLYIVIGHCYDDCRALVRWNVEAYDDHDDAKAHVNNLHHIVTLARANSKLGDYDELTHDEQLSLAQALRGALTPDLQCRILSSYPWYNVGTVPYNKR